MLGLRKIRKTVRAFRFAFDWSCWIGGTASLAWAGVGLLVEGWRRIMKVGFVGGLGR